MYIMGSLDFYRNSGPAKMALCILIDGSSITKAMGQGASFSVVNGRHFCEVTERQV